VLTSFPSLRKPSLTIGLPPLWKLTVVVLAVAVSQPGKIAVGTLRPASVRQSGQADPEDARR
jgi:hypothetical protein